MAISYDPRSRVNVTEAIQPQVDRFQSSMMQQFMMQKEEAERNRDSRLQTIAAQISATPGGIKAYLETSPETFARFLGDVGMAPEMAGQFMQELSARDWTAQETDQIMSDLIGLKGLGGTQAPQNQAQTTTNQAQTTQYGGQFQAPAVAQSEGQTTPQEEPTPSGNVRDYGDPARLAQDLYFTAVPTGARLPINLNDPRQLQSVHESISTKTGIPVEQVKQDLPMETLVQIQKGDLAEFTPATEGGEETLGEAGRNIQFAQRTQSERPTLRFGEEAVEVQIQPVKEVKTTPTGEVDVVSTYSPYKLKDPNLISEYGETQEGDYALAHQAALRATELDLSNDEIINGGTDVLLKLFGSSGGNEEVRKANNRALGILQNAALEKAEVLGIETAQDITGREFKEGTSTATTSAAIRGEMQRAGREAEKAVRSGNVDFSQMSREEMMRPENRRAWVDRLATIQQQAPEIYATIWPDKWQAAMQASEAGVRNAQTAQMKFELEQAIKMLPVTERRQVAQMNLEEQAVYMGALQMQQQVMQLEALQAAAENPDNPEMQRAAEALLKVLPHLENFDKDTREALLYGLGKITTPLTGFQPIYKEGFFGKLLPGNQGKLSWNFVGGSGYVPPSQGGVAYDPAQINRDVESILGGN